MLTLASKAEPFLVPLTTALSHSWQEHECLYSASVTRPFGLHGGSTYEVELLVNPVRIWLELNCSPLIRCAYSIDTGLMLYSAIPGTTVQGWAVIDP
jgi:hypothetical protein